MQGQNRDIITLTHLAWNCERRISFATFIRITHRQNGCDSSDFLCVFYVSGWPEQLVVIFFLTTFIGNNAIMFITSIGNMISIRKGLYQCCRYIGRRVFSIVYGWVSVNGCLISGSIPCFKQNQDLFHENIVNQMKKAVYIKELFIELFGLHN